MADLYVKATGSATAPYDTWAKAATSLATVVTAAAANDRIFVHNGFTQAVASVTYTPAAGVTLYSTSDTTHEPPTVYATGASLNTTTGLPVVQGGNWFGFTFTIGTGASTVTFTIGGGDNFVTTFEDCSWSQGGTGTFTIIIGPSSGATATTATHTRNCHFLWGSTASGFQMRGHWRDEGSNLDEGATHPTTLFKSFILPSVVDLVGSDLSGDPNTYFSDGAAWYIATMVNCKINASATILATGSNDEAGEVYGFDCNSGDNHYSMFHYNYRGNTVVSTAKYVTADGAAYDGASARHSWTVTSVNGIYGMPYFSPWIERYNSSLTALTPYFEIARDGSATAYNDDEVWAEFALKITSGSTRATIVTDRKVPLAAAAAQTAGTGTGNWTGLSGTANSMKADVAQTFAEIGVVRGRIAVTGTVSVSLDPKIRGLATDSTMERVLGASFVNGFASAGTGSGGLSAIGNAG